MKQVKCGPNCILDLDGIRLAILNGQANPPDPFGTVLIYHEALSGGPLTISGELAVAVRAHLRLLNLPDIGVPLPPPPELTPGALGPQPVDDAKPAAA